MSTNFHHEAPLINDTSYSQGALYLPPGIMQTSQRQQVSQQLYINTQLSPSQIDDPENSTASSSSFGKALQTPYFQSYPGLQPSVHISSPQLASAESGMLMPVRERVI